MIQKAKFVKEIVVKDPDTGNLIEIEIYKHENGGMFGVDSSYLDQKFGDEEGSIPDPLGEPEDLVILPEID